MEERELLRQVKADITGITETRWNSTRDCNAGIEGYVLFIEDRNKSRLHGSTVPQWCSKV